MSDKGFSYVNSGTNNDGNHYCVREYRDGGRGYHYSNLDGSYYYSNPNGSTYYNNGTGGSTYTSPSGYRSSQGYGYSSGASSGGGGGGQGNSNTGKQSRTFHLSS